MCLCVFGKYDVVGGCLLLELGELCLLCILLVFVDWFVWYKLVFDCCECVVDFVVL